MPQMQPGLAGKCLQLCISSGKQGDWDACLGSLRLGRLLGWELQAEHLEALGALKAAALENNGGPALLAAEALHRVL